MVPVETLVDILSTAGFTLASGTTFSLDVVVSSSTVVLRRSELFPLALSVYVSLVDIELLEAAFVTAYMESFG